MINIQNNCRLRRLIKLSQVISLVFTLTGCLSTATPNLTPAPRASEPTAVVTASPAPAEAPTREPTDTPSPTPSPSATITPSKTPTLEYPQNEPGQYVYFFDNIYGQYAVINPVDIEDYPPKFLPLGVGQAYHVGFSNFSDRIYFRKSAYPHGGQKKPQDQVWITDFRGEKLIKVYAQTEGEYIGEVWWTPDDQHLVIHKTELPGSAVIYHMQTGRLETWPYECDQWALSPHSGRLALWCRAIGSLDGFAVIEWGGEIWHSTAAPEKTFAPTGNTAWSADGLMLAYSDDTQPDGNLYLVDYTGKQIQIIPGIMVWRTKAVEAPWEASITWSANGKRLLIFAPGVDEKLCPADEYNLFIKGPDRNPPCWHVYDIESKQMVWNLSDVLKGNWSSGSRAFEEATLSANGRYLALAVNRIDPSIQETWVIDLETNQKIYEFPIWLPTTIRWGLVFEADFSTW